MLDDLNTKNWINTPALYYADQATIPITNNNCQLVFSTDVADPTQTFVWLRKTNPTDLFVEVTRNGNGTFVVTSSGI